MQKVTMSIVAVLAVVAALLCVTTVQADATATRPVGPSIKVVQDTDERGARYTVTLKLADGDVGAGLRLAVGKSDSTTWGPANGPRSAFTVKIMEVADAKVKVACTLVLNEHETREEWRLDGAIEQDKWVNLERKPPAK